MKHIPDEMLTELAYLFEIEADLLCPKFVWPGQVVVSIRRAEAERLRYTAFGISMRRMKMLKPEKVFDQVAARYAGEEPCPPTPRDKK